MLDIEVFGGMEYCQLLLAVGVRGAGCICIIIARAVGRRNGDFVEGALFVENLNHGGKV